MIASESCSSSQHLTGLPHDSVKDGKPSVTLPEGADLMPWATDQCPFRRPLSEGGGCALLAFRLLPAPSFRDMLAKVMTASARAIAMGTPSQSQDMGAASDSHDANLGDVHAAPAYDIPVRSVFEAERRQRVKAVWKRVDLLD